MTTGPASAGLFCCRERALAISLPQLFSDIQSALLTVPISPTAHRNYNEKVRLGYTFYDE